MTHTYVLETWQGYDEGELVSAVVVYDILPGCPGDYATPPQPPTVTIEDGYYEISRPRLPDIKVPMADTHYDSLDIETIKDRIYENHFN